MQHRIKGQRMMLEGRKSGDELFDSKTATQVLNKVTVQSIGRAGNLTRIHSTSSGSR
jgi:hypothetical protein